MYEVQPTNACFVVDAFLLGFLRIDSIIGTRVVAYLRLSAYFGAVDTSKGTHTPTAVVIMYTGLVHGLSMRSTTLLSIQTQTVGCGAWDLYCCNTTMHGPTACT